MDPKVLCSFGDVEAGLAGVLEHGFVDRAAIDAATARLEEKLGVGVYSQLLYMLCHLEFEPAEAKQHWTRAREHRDHWVEKLGEPLDFRVALLDYFVRIHQQFENPTIIELKIFQRTQDHAIRDELTSLHNYRFFRAELERSIARARRTREPLSLAMFDVDHFKFYNDRNGHLAGDQVLKQIAKTMLEQVRDSDLVARYGGEEFVVLLPDAGSQEAFDVASRICSVISAQEFPFQSHQPNGVVSVSGGVATLRIDADEALPLVEAADTALYRAKSNGKNRVLRVSEENRGYQRVATSVSGRMQPLADVEWPFLTQDLSEQGFHFEYEGSFSDGEGLSEGDWFRFQLQLPAPGNPIDGVARIVRVVPSANLEGAQIGVEIVEISSADLESLSRYLEDQVEDSEMNETILINDALPL